VSLDTISAKPHRAEPPGLVRGFGDSSRSAGWPVRHATSYLAAWPLSGHAGRKVATPGLGPSSGKPATVETATGWRDKPEGGGTASMGRGFWLVISAIAVVMRFQPFSPS
jgi:hypothetical protein